MMRIVGFILGLLLVSPVLAADNSTLPVCGTCSASETFANKDVGGVKFPQTNPTAVAGQGCTPYHLSGGTAATNNSTNIKSSTGSLCDMTVINTTATVYYLKIYDSSTAPTCSSATGLKHVYPIPASGGGIQRSLPMQEAYASGIGFCVTAGGTDTDNTSAATGVFIEASYK